MNVEETMGFILKQQTRGKKEMATIGNITRAVMRRTAETSAKINRLAVEIKKLRKERRTGGKGRHSRN